MSITTITTMGRLALVLCSAATLSACNTPPPAGRAAVAVLQPTAGNAVTGPGMRGDCTGVKVKERRSGTEAAQKKMLS